MSLNDSTPLVNPTSGAVNFVVATPAASVAGAPVDVTVTAVDASGNVVTDYGGTVRVFTSDPLAGGAFTSYTFTVADQGTHAFSGGVTLYTAGPDTVLVGALLRGHG